MSAPEDFLCDFLLKRNRFHKIDEKWKPTTAAMKRFLRNCRGMTPSMMNCVAWVGGLAHPKYSSSPRFYLNGQQVSLRKMIYVWFVGPLENGDEPGDPSQWITTCHKRLCVNPSHLKLRRDLRIRASIRKKKKRKKRRRRLALSSLLPKQQKNRVKTKKILCKMV